MYRGGIRLTYVVTGGAGFIGSHISEYLADLGHEVVIFDNLFSGKEENIRHLLDNPKVSFVRNTITSLESLNTAYEGADGIFHQAAIVSVPGSVKNPLATIERNVTGLIRIIRHG